ILANRYVESETYIETGDLKGGGAFVLHRPGEEPICLTSIEDLLAKLHAISF
ncbi:ABC transporter ATP-binding protein, partial [Bacteroides stercoris]